MTATPLRLELRNISKSYASVHANRDVSLQVLPGEIHAVLGENGAGKSTLMKVIYGAVQPDAGQIFWGGQAVQVASPARARQLGISMVYQHFSLFDTLSAAQNVWLGLDRGQSLDQVSQRMALVASTYGLAVQPEQPVHSLSVGERQRVEIVRALMTEPKLLILDEPTSVLTPQAVETLFVTLRQLAKNGCSILYISHKLDEVRALCHRCTVLRGGRVTGHADPRLASNADLSALMIGTVPPPLQHAAATPGPVALRVQGLSLPPDGPYGVPLQSVSFELRAGELLGLAGVSGNGQKALMAALSGEDTRAASGTVLLTGADGQSHDVSSAGPAQRRALGLHSVPEERLGRGAVPSLSLALNTLLTRQHAVGQRGWRRGWIAPAAAQHLARSIINRFKVKAAGPQALASSLSGGNLQKFIMGRELSAQPRVLLVSQPTWGVDVGAAAQIRAELLALRDQGCAVLVVSEELDELFALSDRLVVMAKGRLSPSLPAPQASVAQVGAWMSGLWNETNETNKSDQTPAERSP